MITLKNNTKTVFAICKGIHKPEGVVISSVIKTYNTPEEAEEDMIDLIPEQIEPDFYKDEENCLFVVKLDAKITNIATKETTFPNTILANNKPLA